MSSKPIGELTNEEIDIINGTVEEIPNITLNEPLIRPVKVKKEKVKIKKEKIIKETVVLGWW